MAVLTIVLAAVFIVGAAIGAYALFAPRREPAHREPTLVEELARDEAWPSEVVEEFERLNEAARCEMIFAAASIDDERSRRLLEFALDDPAEAVALAAAHALATRGRGDLVAQYAQREPSERARRLVETLAFLE